MGERERSGPNELPALALSIGLWPDRERFTMQEAAGRVGVDERLLHRVWRAAGFVDPPGDARVVNAADIEMYETLKLGIDFLDEDVILQFVRVLGAAVQRVADAAVNTFVVNVGPTRMQADPSGLELARANATSLALIPGLVQAFDVLLRHRLEAERRPINVDVARGVEVQRRSVGFADLVGSTTLAQQLDMHELAVALSEFDTTASELITECGGRVVKLIGDEVMFVASEPAVAVHAALALVDAFAAHHVLPAVRGAVASGEVLARDGDYSGAVVNLAVRAAKSAEPSSVLVDDATCASVIDDFAVRDRGTFALRGFEDPVRLHQVTRSG